MIKERKKPGLSPLSSRQPLEDFELQDLIFKVLLWLKSTE